MSTSRQVTTRNRLGIFFDGEEQPGITCYGFWPFSPPLNNEPLFPRKLWPPQTRLRRSLLRGEHWTVLVWDICIVQWPPAEEWLDVLKSTLSVMIDSGATVAWCGLEGYFLEPPFLFSTPAMSGGVYAAYASELGFRCRAGLDEPFKALTDEDLRQLRHLERARKARAQ